MPSKIYNHYAGKTYRKNFWYRIEQIALFLYLVYITIPAIAPLLSQNTRYFYLILMFSFSLLGTIFETRLRLKYIISILLIGLFSSAMYFGRWKLYGFSITNYFSNALIFWLSALFSFSIYTFTKKDRKFFFDLLIILTSISIVTTIIGEINYPNAARDLAGGGNSTLITFYKIRNIGDYGFVYGLVLLLPTILYKLRCPGNKRKFYIIFILGVFFTIIITQYTIAILLSLFIITGNYFLRIRNKLFSIIFLFIAVAIIVLFNKYIVIFIQEFKAITDYYNLATVSDRLGLIEEFLVHNITSGDALIRLDLYYMSWRIFIDNPLFGSFFRPVLMGGHSELFDILGASGITGFFLLVTIILIQFFCIPKFWRNRNINLLLLTYSCFIILAIFNTLLSSAQVGISIFLVFALISDSKME